MERNIISWNLPNWGSVFLMAVAGYAVVGVARQIWLRYGPGAPASNAGGY